MATTLYTVKSQAVCTFQFMCKHIKLKHAMFPKLWVLQSFNTVTVTFSFTQSMGNRGTVLFNRPLRISY